MILITNDDGYNSPGLHALAEVLSGLDECLIVAPLSEQSGVSYSLNVSRPLRVEYTSVAGVRTLAVDGSPVDCVKLALYELLPSAPDLVVSGINLGVNLGPDVFYSGTVGGALEGALSGLAAVAVSTVPEGGTRQLSTTADIAVRVISGVRQLLSGKAFFLNINVPPLNGVEDPLVTLAPMGPSRFMGRYEKRIDPRGKPYFWLGGAEAVGESIPAGCDIDLFRKGYVTVTPLLFNMTDTTVLQALRTSLPEGFPALDDQ